MGQQNISTLTTCFAKHSQSVCKKHYVQMYLGREAARIYWSCYQKYRTSDDVIKAVDVRKSLIKNVELASTKKIKEWIDGTTGKLKLLFKNFADDANLLKQLGKFHLEENGVCFHFTTSITHLASAYSSIVKPFLCCS